MVTDREGLRDDRKVFSPAPAIVATPVVDFLRPLKDTSPGRSLHCAVVVRRLLVGSLRRCNHVIRNFDPKCAILWVCYPLGMLSIRQRYFGTNNGTWNVQFGLVHFGSAISHRIFSASSSDYTSSGIDSKSDTVTWISRIIFVFVL
jgi:hypothetical protein